MITGEEKTIVKKQIKTLVFLHGCYVKEVTGLDIDATKEETRLYNEFVGGMISLEDIKKDIQEYKEMAL